MRAKEVEDFSTILRQRIELVNDEIERILLEENPFLLPRNVEYEDPVVHTLWSGGKRIRPILCLFACDAVGGEEIKALPTAAGVEFLHTFTLVHDDVMDRTTLRRGRPSLHHLWGEPIAITAGDTLYSLAFKSFSKNAEVEGVSDEQVRKVIEVATEKCIALAKGQTMDIVFEGRENVDLKEYFQMVKLKTSSLLELSLEAGGIIGGGSEREIDALEKFGTFSGIAFQIQDDILDIEGKDTGKPVGTDLRRGKKTVILIHALENADESERRRILEFIKEKKRHVEDELANVIDTIRSIGSIEYARQLVKKTLKRAEEQLSKLKSRGGTRNLRQLVKYLMNRER